MVIKFDLSEIPSNADIVEAIYSMFFFFGDTAEQGNTNLCSLFTVSKQWVDDEVTWKNADNNTAWENTDPDTKFYNPLLNDTMASPGGCDFSRENLVLGDYASTNDWEHYDVTDIVKKTVTKEIPNYGFMVKQFICPKTLQGNNPKQRDNYGKSYWSSEYENVEKRPKLTVKYEETAIQKKLTTNKATNKIVTQKTATAFKIAILFEDSYTVSICDIKGRTIHSFQGNGKNRFTIPVKSLSPGIHFIRVNTPGKIYVKKCHLLK